MKCSVCGNEVSDKIKYCPRCGSQIKRETKEMDPFTPDFFEEKEAEDSSGFQKEPGWEKHPVIEREQDTEAEEIPDSGKSSSKTKILKGMAVVAGIAICIMVAYQVGKGGFSFSAKDQQNEQVQAKNPSADMKAASPSDSESTQAETEANNALQFGIFESTVPESEEETRVNVAYCDSSEMNFPDDASGFAEVSSPDGVYTLKYPKNFFQTGYYDKKEKKFEFKAADGITELSITEGEAPIKNDPVGCANWLLEQYRSYFLIAKETPYIFKSKKVAESGYSRSVIAGPLVENSNIGKYMVSACTNEKLYTLIYTYQSDAADKVGFDYTPKGYIVDCVYRGWSISGSTYELRTYKQYMADEMGTKKP